MRSKGSKIIIIVSIIFVLLMAGLIFLFFPRINLENDKINLGDYIKVTANNVFYNLSDNVSISDNVNNKVIGKYKVKATFNYAFLTFNKYFDVEVVDKIKPEIVLKGDSTVKVCPLKDYEEEGYSASDNYDGDLTNNVVVIKESNSILYKVIDKSGNESVVERKIDFTDDEAPVITLKGNQNMTIYAGNSYNEPGYSASDKCDGDLTNNVLSTGTVDINKIGTYTIYYSVKDAAGNEGKAERTVNVRNRPVYSGESFIYLTFDDGPSERTREILDILDDEGVKATFFVCGANAYTVRAHNSGHTIALHSNTHNYAYIYASSNNYFEDLNAISNTVYNTVGIRSNIIRFPGGASNTISRNYNVGIMSYLTNEVVNRGYTYFDWNVDSNDAGGDVYNSSRIYYNVVNSLYHGRSNVVLMHDSGGHSATVNALRNIIRYGKDNGFTFLPITSDTYPVRHGVNN